MSYILCIDTALGTAGICLVREAAVLCLDENNSPNDHASWIQPAINKMFQDARVGFDQLNAVAVTAGPGSYTGLRVGMATAKGICYALRIPLITVSSLRIMAMSAKEQAPGIPGIPSFVYFRPLIDARRMEVFTGFFDQQLVELEKEKALILDPQIFDSELKDKPILFFGTGSAKWKNICRHPNAYFGDISYDFYQLAALARENFRSGLFSDLTYIEPAYIKNFYIHHKI